MDSMIFGVNSPDGDIVCFDIDIMDDNRFEKTESFYLMLASEAGVSILTPQIPVIITDDDGKSRTDYTNTRTPTHKQHTSQCSALY